MRGRVPGRLLLLAVLVFVACSEEHEPGDSGDGEPGDDGSGDGGGDDSNGGDDCVTDAQFFEERLWGPVFASRCLACHVEGGVAARTRMVLVPEETEGWLDRNVAAVQAVAKAELDGRPLLLLKPTGRIAHTGGVLIPPDAPEYPDLEALVARLRDEVDPCGEPLDPEELPPPDDAGCDDLAPGRRLLRRLSHTEYRNTLRDLTGVEVDAHGTFVADPLVHGFENHPEALEVSGLLATQYNQVAESVGEQIDIAAHLPCEIAEGDMDCAHRFIAQFGKRAFRRPLTAEEIATYRELFGLVMSQECFEQGARWVVAAMLQSPHVIYRSELGRAGDDGFTLTPYEIASELSYLLWQTMPDARLFERAADGSLLDPEVRAEELERMLSDPRTLDMVNDFMGRWLGVDGVLSVVRDSEIYEALYFELREPLLLETRLLAADLWTRGRPFSELFTVDHTFLNEALSEYYELPLDGPADALGFHKVSLNGARAGGVLAHGSLMTAHASPTSSSPIHRGILIREQLLCEPLPPPPAGLDIQAPEFDPTLTTRERFAQHTNDEMCAGCHRLIDGLGFGFEHYDGIGRYREMDGDAPVNAQGVVVRADAADVPFDGVKELGEFLADDPQVARCYTRQWLRFGVGEIEGQDDDCNVEALTAALTDAEGRMSAVLEAIPRTPSFTRRTGDDGETDGPGVELVATSPGGSVEVPDPTTPPAGLETPACGTPVVGPSGPGPGAEGLEISSREDRWETGLCAYYTVRNVTVDPVEWAFEAEVEGTINNSWNVVRSGDSGRVRFSGVDYNRIVQPDQQVEFGYCANL